MIRGEQSAAEKREEGKAYEGFAKGRPRIKIGDFMVDAELLYQPRAGKPMCFSGGMRASRGLK